MAIQTEAKGNTFFLWCRGIAVVLAAVSGLVLGLLNWFKEVRDPRAKVGYQEIAKQLEALSSDLRKLADTTHRQGEEIATIQNWIINERDKRGVQPSSTLIKMHKQVLSRAKVVQPPARKLEAWEGLPVQQQQVQLVPLGK